MVYQRSGGGQEWTDSASVGKRQAVAAVTVQRNSCGDGPPDSAGLRLGLGEVRWTLVEKGQAGRSGTHTGSSETSGVGKRPELWRRSDLQREVRRLLHCLVPVQNGLGIRFRMPSLLVFRLFRGPDEGVPLPDGSKVPDAEVPHQGVLGL